MCLTTVSFSGKPLPTWHTWSSLQTYVDGPSLDPRMDKAETPKMALATSVKGFGLYLLIAKLLMSIQQISIPGWCESMVCSGQACFNLLIALSGTDGGSPLSHAYPASQSHIYPFGIGFTKCDLENRVSPIPTLVFWLVGFLHLLGF